MKLVYSIIISLMLSPHSIAQSTDFKQLNSFEFEKLIAQEDGILLDVRTKNEFENEHIANAEQLNFYSLGFRRHLLRLPKEKAIYLYCNTGYRSEISARILSNNGYEKVYNLEKGIMEWNIYDLPTVSDPNAQPDFDNKMSLAEYQKLILSDTLVLIDFYAPWCAPCKKMMPMVDSLKTKYHGTYKIEKVNVDASKSLVKEMRISTVPYFALYRNGKLITEQYGYISENEIVNWFNKYK